MTRARALTTFHTATTLDGFLADPDDSLAWLLRQDFDWEAPSSVTPYLEGVGALVMGSTTYTWIVDHLRTSGEAWPYRQPAWVMTSRALAAVDGADVRFASGDVAEVYDELVRVADGKGIWVVGGGDLAGQFADAGLLDEVAVSVAPVTLGAGRPLLPRRLDLELLETTRNRDFVTARYRVLGPLAEDR